MVALWWRMLEVGGLFLYSNKKIKKRELLFTLSLFHFYLVYVEMHKLVLFFNEVKNIE